MARIIVPHNHCTTQRFENVLVVALVNIENPDYPAVYAFVLPVVESLSNLRNYGPVEVLGEGETFSRWGKDFFTVIEFISSGAEIEFKNE